MKWIEVVRQLFSNDKLSKRIVKNDVANFQNSQPAKPKPKPEKKVVNTCNQCFVITTSDDGETNFVTLVEEPVQQDKPKSIVVKQPKPQPKAKWPAKANFMPDEKDLNTFGARYDTYCYSLPKYRFFDDEPNIPFEAQIEIKQYLDTIADAKVKIEKLEADKDYEQAAACLEVLIRHECWQPWPYTKLMTIYNEAGLHKEAEQLRQHSIKFFSHRREMMAHQIRMIAAQQGEAELVEQMISAKQKISYYQGLYVMYDPYPCIEEWLAMGDLSKQSSRS